MKFMGRKLGLSVFTLFNVVSILTIYTASASEAAPVKLETFKTHSRLSIRIDKGSKVELRDKKESLEILLKEMSLFDLGSPFGSEKAWINRFIKISDYRLSKIDIRETNEGVLVRCHWNFPKGSKALYQPKMEKFTFRRSDMPLFVMDFWIGKGPTLAEVKKKKEKIRVVNRKREIKRRKEERADYERQLASAAPLVLPEPDIKDFCSAPKDYNDDVFLPFYPVHEAPDFSKWFSFNTPDADYPYLEPTGTDKESSYVRLAINLYRGGKPALAIRTIDFFEAEIKKSEFSDQMTFLRANALIKLGHAQKAHRIFKKLMESSSNSPVTLSSGIYMAGTSFREKKYLIALEYFNHLIRKFPQHRLNWVFHLGAGECLYQIGDSERSAKEYDRTIRLAPDEDSQMVAASRLGDIYLQRRQYAQALATYYRVIKHYEGKTAIRPELLLNRAEALFWLKRSNKAEEEYRSFVTKYGGHPEGWRASLRLAQILSIRKEESDREKAKEWYSYTINHYPTSPGVVLARIRLAECKDHGGLKLHSAKSFFEKDAEEFMRNPDAKKRIMMTRYKDLLGLYHVRAMSSLGHYGEVVNTAISRLRKVVRNNTVKQISRTLKIAFYKNTEKLLRDGSAFEALSYYGRYIESIPHDDNPIPPQFLLQLARNAVEVGFGSLGEKILDQYEHYQKAYLKKFTLDRVQRVRLESEMRYTVAKVLWLSKGMSEVDHIKKELKKLSPDSFYQTEKETILGLIEQKNNNYKQALQHAESAAIFLSKLSDKKIKKVRTPELKLWTAQLREKIGDLRDAAGVYAKLQSSNLDVSRGLASEIHPKTRDPLSLSVLGLEKLPVARALMLSEAESYMKAKDYRQASKAYSRAVAKGVKDSGLLFSYARSLRRTGVSSDFKKSNEVLALIVKSDQDPFWKKAAQEVLDGKSKL